MNFSETKIFYISEKIICQTINQLEENNYEGINYYFILFNGRVI
jgi:hypothetical protein